MKYKEKIKLVDSVVIILIIAIASVFVLKRQFDRINDRIIVIENTIMQLKVKTQDVDLIVE